MNIRSLRKHFQTFLTTINNIIEKIQLIVLIETNITDDENCFYNIHGFNSTFLNRGEGKGGGIVVYTKQNINFKHIKISTVYFELIQLELEINKQPLSLLAIYRQPKLNKNLFIIELEKVIKQIAIKQNIVIVGDINIDILSENNIVTNYTDMCS